MASRSASAHKDLVLSVIEEEEDDDVEVGIGDKLADAQSATASLASAAEQEMLELQHLLAKVKTGTATRDDKDRVGALTNQLRTSKTNIFASKTRERTLATKTKMLQLAVSVKERQIKSVIKTLAEAESVDVAFVMDATGSMTPDIEAVKHSIRRIVADIQRTNQMLKLRLALVAYRDLDIGPKRFETLDFVSDVGRFHSFLLALTAIGNDDLCEDMAIGVQQANRLTWRQSTRIVFLIADYPCHGSKFQWEPSDSGNYREALPVLTFCMSCAASTQNQAMVPCLSSSVGSRATPIE